MSKKCCVGMETSFLKDPQGVQKKFYKKAVYRAVKVIRFMKYVLID